MTRLQDAHRIAPEITPTSAWVLTRLMIAGTAVLTFSLFAVLAS